MTRPPPSPPLRKNFPRQLDNLTASDVSSAVNHANGTPASIARLIIAWACRGLVATLDLRRDARRPAPLRVFGPGLRQVQLPVDQRVPEPGGVRQEHPDLAVLRPSGGPGILSLDSRRPDALLQEPGVIGDQHPVRLAQLPGHIS